MMMIDLMTILELDALIVYASLDFDIVDAKELHVEHMGQFSCQSLDVAYYNDVLMS
jgi:hypothetical protein